MFFIFLKNPYFGSSSSVFTARTGIVSDFFPPGVHLVSTFSSSACVAKRNFFFLSRPWRCAQQQQSGCIAGPQRRLQHQLQPPTAAAADHVSHPAARDSRSHWLPSAVPVATAAAAAGQSAVGQQPVHGAHSSSSTTATQDDQHTAPECVSGTV